MIQKFELDVSTQKQRLADAERKLKEKETKTARNKLRVAGNKILNALEKLSLLKGTQALEDDHRIFLMTYGPVVGRKKERNSSALARNYLAAWDGRHHRQEIPRTPQRASRQSGAVLAPRARTYLIAAAGHVVL